MLRRKAYKEVAREDRSLDYDSLTVRPNRLLSIEWKLTNRDIQEFTVGYWYDFYKGARGRFRQGIQYGYAQRKTWADLNGLAPEGLDNIFETSFRYYLP